MAFHTREIVNWATEQYFSLNAHVNEVLKRIIIIASSVFFIPDHNRRIVTEPMKSQLCAQRSCICAKLKYSVSYTRHQPKWTTAKVLLYSAPNWLIRFESGYQGKTPKIIKHTMHNSKTAEKRTQNSRIRKKELRIEKSRNQKRTQNW